VQLPLGLVWFAVTARAVRAAAAGIGPSFQRRERRLGSELSQGRLVVCPVAVLQRFGAQKPVPNELPLEIDREMQRRQQQQRPLHAIVLFSQ